MSVRVIKIIYMRNNNFSAMEVDTTPMCQLPVAIFSGCASAWVYVRHNILNRLQCLKLYAEDRQSQQIVAIPTGSTKKYIYPGRFVWI